MLVTFQVCHKDSAELVRLLEWCQRLGSYKGHDALIVADAATPWDQAMAALKIAKGLFRSATIITNEAPINDWVEGPKSLFIASAKYAAARGVPFLVMETDAIPLRAGWLDEIENEYRHAANTAQFMGHVYNCTNPGLPSVLMSGIGVYAPVIMNALPMIQAGRNWDVAMTDYVMPRAQHTKLIHHLWGEPNRPPTFARKGIAGTEVFGLDQIPPEAVLWHRNKDHSLIRLLERKLFPQAKPELITVCFNVHGGDVGMAVLHARWLRQMGRRNPQPALICHDASCPISEVGNLRRELEAAFEKLETFVYPRPPVAQYPASANWAWQCTAREMERRQGPWLWLEADAIALKPDWLDQLQAAYDAEGLPFMGPVVPHLGHVNGGAIYPADTPIRMPRAMAAIHEAWDMVGKADMGMSRHDATPLMFHLWTLVNRNAHPVGGGDLPVGITAEEIRRWLPREAVYLHRIKDRSVLDLLLSGQFKP